MAARADCPLLAKLVYGFEWPHMVSPCPCLVIPEKGREGRGGDKRREKKGGREGGGRLGRGKEREIFLKSIRQT